MTFLGLEKIFGKNNVSQRIGSILKQESKKKILSFVDPKKDPSYYIKRYTKEPKYKDWFNRNFPNYTIYDAVGLTESEPQYQIKNYIKPKKILKRFWPHLILLCIALAVYSPGIFVPDSFFNFGDYSFPFNLEKRWSAAFSPLNYNTSPERFPYYQGYLPALSTLFGLNSIGVPLWFLNHALLVFGAFFTGFAVYFLINVLISNSESKIPALLGGSFAILNPTFVWHDPLLIISYAAIFFSLGIFILAFRKQRKKYYLIIPFTSLLTLWTPLGFLFSCLLIPTFFMLAYLLQLRLPKISEIKFFLILIILVITFNFFWLGPLIFFELSGTDVIASSVSPLGKGEATRVLFQTSYPTTFISALTLSFNNCLWCEEFYNDAEFGNMRILFSFLPVILGVWALAANRAEVYLKIFLLFAIILIVLSVGTHYSITNTLYTFFNENLYGFQVLRDTNQIFYFMSFVFSIILALGSYHLLSFFTKWTRNMLIFLIAGIIIFNGSVLFLYGPEQNLAIHSVPFSIPDDYSLLNKLLSIDKDSGYKALILPLAGGGVNYEWNEIKKPGMRDIMIDYLPVPSVAVATTFTDDISYGSAIDTGISFLSESTTLDLASTILKNLGVKYIVIHHDLSDSSLNKRSYLFSTNLETRSDIFQKIDGFSKFEVFELIDTVPPLRYLIPDNQRFVQVSETMIPLEYVSLGTSGAIKMSTNEGSISTTWIPNLDKEFGILFWLKTPDKLLDATILSSNSMISRFEKNDLKIMPVYSLDMNKDGILTFNLLGKRNDIALDSVPLSSGNWHLVYVYVNPNEITLTIDGTKSTSTSRDYELNTPVYSEDNSIFLGNSSRYENKGAANFAFSYLYVYSDKILDWHLVKTFEDGPTVLPGPIGTPLGNWDFLSSNRDPSVSGYHLSDEGVEITRTSNPIMVPLTTFLDNKEITLITANYAPEFQNYDFTLSKLDYSIETPEVSTGFIVLNTKQNPSWILRDSTGREIPQIKISEEWNVWETTEGMVSPFSVKNQGNDVILFSMIFSIFSYLLILFLIFNNYINKKISCYFSTGLNNIFQTIKLKINH